MFKTIILVGIGGGIGSICRYLLGYLAGRHFNLVFPYGTLSINLLGSLIIGIVYGLAFKNIVSEDWRIFLATGFCGGFTTFSSFAFENVTLIQEGEIGLMLLYSAVSLIAGLLLTYAGLLLGRVV
jgi:CrcB protein